MLNGFTMRLFLAFSMLGLALSGVVSAQALSIFSPPIAPLLNPMVPYATSFLGQGADRSSELQAHLSKAHQFLQQKQPTLAIPEYAAAVAVDPNNLDAQANLGVLQYFSGQLPQAEPHLRAAVALDPKQAKLQALLGFCEHRSGEYERARTDLTAALPGLTDPTVRRQAGLELVEIDTSASDLPAASRVIDQLKAEFPTDREVLYATYRIHTDLAGEALLDLSVAAPNSGQMHQAMAHELVRERDNTAAVTNLRAALQADPNLPGARFELAEALHVSQQPALKAEAESQYQQVLKENPSDIAAMTRLGDIAAEKGEHAQAITLYKQALALQANNEDAAVGLAHELTETGQPEAALPLLTAVVKADPSNIQAHYRLSALYRRLHRPEDAKHEIAEYERLKTVKEKLRGVYEAMRMDAPKKNDETN